MVGVVNILLQPEYGRDWIAKEVLGALPEDAITDELIDQVDDLITEKLKSLAAEIVATLPPEVVERNGLESLR